MKRIKVKVITGARKQEIIEVGEEEYRVKLRSAPIKGRANRELVGLLADYFKVKKFSIQIISGIHSQVKTIIIR